MLISEIPGKKTYEEWMAEMIGQIPVYSTEWTNFNPSDPGMTILENLTAFQVLQQESMCSLPDQVREKLLELGGFQAEPENPATVLLEPVKKEDTVLFRRHQKFHAGDICYETEEEVLTVPGNLLGIYRRQEEQTLNILSDIRKNRFSDGYAFLGSRPAQGDEFFLLLDDLPELSGRLELFVEIGQSKIRNKDSKDLDNLFALPEFSLLTSDGYQKIGDTDETEGFIRSGRITLSMPEEKGILTDEFGGQGYLIRCLLKEANYDIPPLMKDIHVFLIPVVQKDTCSALLRFPAGEKVIIRDAMLTQCYLFCYRREGGGYREYVPATDCGESGGNLGRRDYHRRDIGFGEAEIIFSAKTAYSAYHPDPESDICCVLSTEEVMLNRSLGIVLGYDLQEFSLETFPGLLAEDFCIMTKKRDNQGEEYCFFGPEEESVGSLQYLLDGKNRKIIVTDAGDYEGAELLLAGCSLFVGEEGNIRSSNVFTADAADSCVTFTNPAPGSGGRYREEIKQRISRFAEDIRHPGSLVTRADYEQFVKNLPELCIHKVHAYPQAGSQTMQVAVKPYGMEELPVLSPLYRQIILSAMEEKRMLSTEVRLLQPIYTAVHVEGTIYIREYYKNYREKIEDTIRDLLDYVNTDRQFGETLSFYEVYGAIEKMECVDEIFHLSLVPDQNGAVRQNGLDLIPAENCLLYPGNIRLEFHARQLKE